MRAIWGTCCLLMATAVSVSPASSQTSTLLGEEVASFERETDSFEIARDRRRYDSIQLIVERGTVRLYSLSVTFRDGQTRNVEPDRILKPANLPFTLRFRNKARRIAKVEATYRTLRQRSSKRAIVSLKGVISKPPRNVDPDGSSRAVTADLRDGRATIGLANGARRLSSVQVEVGLRNVFVRHITVAFGNGDLKRFDLNRWIDEGRRSPRLTFKGGPRRVRQVTIGTRPSQSRDIARFVLHTTRSDDASPSNERSVRTDRAKDIDSENRFGPVPPLDRGGAPRNHILLGTLNVVLGKPSLELAVNRNIGPIVSLALRAGDRDVGVGAISAVFAKGGSDRIQVLRQLGRNNVSPRIKLKRSGKLRSIKIKASALTTQPTRLLVYAMLDQSFGQRDRGARTDPGQWVNLAFTRPPRFNPKTEVINVGRSKGRLEAFRLRVEKHDVRFKGIQIVFGNGSEQEFPFYDKVNDGVTTSRFVLSRKGRGRYVQKIIVRYNTTANFKGRALVAFEGFKR